MDIEYIRGADLLIEVILGACILGFVAGLIGPFLVVRKMSLVSDALAHALMPGIVLAFFIFRDRNFLILGLGAWLTCLVATQLITWLSEQARIRQDSAIGIVLAGMFSLGVLFLGMVQKVEGIAQAGLNHFFLGQLAALSSAEIRAMMAVAAVSSLLISGLFFKLRILSFDSVFTFAQDRYGRWVERIFSLLIVIVLVAGIHAVGVLLVSALLVIPAATALLFSKKLHRVVLCSALLGAAGAALGTFLSSLQWNLPSGATIVLILAIAFLMSFFFVSRESVLSRFLVKRSRELRLRRENSLKALYQVLEMKEFHSETVTIKEFASKRNQTMEQAFREMQNLESEGLAVLDKNSGSVSLSPQGWVQACSIVRNHRLWELYLCLFENKSALEVHEEAEFQEHYLDEATVAKIEKKLKFPHKDPHGKSIPSVQDMAIYVYKASRRL